VTLPTWNTAFVDNVSTVTAAFLNDYVRTQIPKAIDGAGGGAYTPTAVIDIQGTAGIKISCTGSAARLQYSSRSITRHFAFNATTTSGNWGLAPTPHGSWRNTAAGGTLNIYLEGLPNGAELSSLVLRWEGAVGHGALPVLPSIALYRINDDGTETSIASASDTSASTGAYEVAHDITLSAIGHTIDLTLYRYMLIVTGETGGNFVANAKAMKLKGTCTITDQSEW
jgi:hypothetical protein